MMELKRMVLPAAGIFPMPLRERWYGEAWQKDQIEVALRDHEESLIIKTHPLPHLELLFRVKSRFSISIQIFGAHIEIWLGKPVVQFSTFLSESLRPNEERESLRAYTFLNNYQSELLNPTAKNSIPPNVSVVLTISFRSSLGMMEKTVKQTSKAPKILP